MVIRQLPRELVLDILIFYIVLRALDTVEDDTTAFPRPGEKIMYVKKNKHVHKHTRQH